LPLFAPRPKGQTLRSLAPKPGEGGFFPRFGFCFAGFFFAFAICTRDDSAASEA
jgi:hypothetical protein